MAGLVKLRRSALQYREGLVWAGSDNRFEGRRAAVRRTRKLKWAT